MASIYAAECRWATKGREAPPLTVTWADLEHTVLSEKPEVGAARRVRPSM